jgi:hypothetical protein
MHPNLYLRTFWQSNFRSEIFVAMSFGEPYQHRFGEVIEPAIRAVTYRGNRLQASRVDLSKSGDSILTDIVEGIAHSVMILADVSTVGHDSKTGQSYRNGNVMYEVGLALACRQSAEVLLIRDDRERFLFDVSTVPHKHVDFSEPENARSILTEEIEARLREIDHISDARIAMSIASMTTQEHSLLRVFAKYTMDQVFRFPTNNIHLNAAIPRLLDKQLIRTARVSHDGHAMFAWTELGRTLADHIETLIPSLPPPPATEAASRSSSSTGPAAQAGPAAKPEGGAT